MVAMVCSGVGIGLVCGWLTGSIVFRSEQRSRDITAGLAADLLTGGWLGLLTDLFSTIFFIISVAIAGLTCYLWYSRIMRRLPERGN